MNRVIPADIERRARFVFEDLHSLAVTYGGDVDAREHTESVRAAIAEVQEWLARQRIDGLAIYMLDFCVVIESCGYRALGALPPDVELV